MSFSNSVFFLPETVGTKHQHETVVLQASGTGKKTFRVMYYKLQIGIQSLSPNLGQTELCKFETKLRKPLAPLAVFFHLI